MHQFMPAHPSLTLTCLRRSSHLQHAFAVTHRMQSDRHAYTFRQPPLWNFSHFPPCSSMSHCGTRSFVVHVSRSPASKSIPSPRISCFHFHSKHLHLLPLLFLLYVKYSFACDYVFCIQHPFVNVCSEITGICFFCFVYQQYSAECYVHI